MFAPLLETLRRLISPNPRATTARRELGDRGEDAAAGFLESHGYQILARNWRSGRDELDLVALAPGTQTLVFIEVKTRDERDPKGGYFAVDARKRRALRRAIAAYMRDIGRPAAHLRFDIIEVRAEGAKSDGKVAMRVIHHCAVSLFHK